MAKLVFGGAARISDEVECGRLNLSMLVDSLKKLASLEISERLLGAFRGDLQEVLGKDQAATVSDVIWWVSLVMGVVGSSGSAQGSRNDQGGRLASPWAADCKGASSASVTTTNQTETVKTDEMKKKTTWKAAETAHRRSTGEETARESRERRRPWRVLAWLGLATSQHTSKTNFDSQIV